MEVKDINAQNSIIAMFRKMTGGDGSLDFSSLINGKNFQENKPADVKLAKGENKLSVETEKFVAKEKTNEKAPVASKDSKEAKPVKSSKHKEEKQYSETATAEPSADNKQDAVKTDKEPQDNTVVATDNVNSVDNTQSDIPSSEVVLEQEAVVENSLTISPEMAVGVVDMLLQPQDVATLSEVAYFDANTGALVQTTGAQLSEAIASGAVSGLKLSDLVTLQGEPMFPELAATAPKIKTSSTEGIDISGFEAISPEEMPEIANLVTDIKETTSKSEQTTTAEASSASISPSDVAENTEDFVDVVNDENIVVADKKVKLDVNVNLEEEKISYRSRQEMIADNVAVTEVVAQPSSPVSEGSNSPMAMTSTNSPINTASNVNIMPQAAVMQTAADVSAVSVTSASVGVETIATTTAPINSGLAAQANRTSSLADIKSPAEDALKGMSKEVVEQVKVNITKSAIKGVDKIDISLKPEDLGHIEIKMQISKDGKLQAHIISSRPETMEVLQKDMQSLQKAFADAGFQTDENSLSFSFQDNNQAWQQQKEENGLRNFMGKIFETESGNDNNISNEMVWDGQSALNIRV